MDNWTYEDETLGTFTVKDGEPDWTGITREELEEVLLETGAWSKSDFEMMDLKATVWDLMEARYHEEQAEHARNHPTRSARRINSRCGSTLVKFECGCVGFLTGEGKLGTYVVQRCDLDPEIEDDRLSEGMYFGDRELSPLGLHWSTQRPTPLSIEETLAVMSKVSGLVEDGMKWRRHLGGE